MRLPDKVQAIVNALYARHKDLAHGTEDQRRTLTGMIAEQTRFALGPDWGWKSAGHGRPPSKDAIAFRGGAELIGWDLFHGGTHLPHEFPESLSLAGQVFIVVPPVDHLKLGAPEEPPTSEEPPSGEPLARIEEKLDRLLSVFRV